ncbi:hypothetical protein [Aporhodopirellula aestuarii]|uniref:Uncharacterized protein n=1 Tax=Aporhodopirellula aestuarii TaxID=2950107 RepID=A0ABT0U303_9BACT|nr:hypothetical protein [Aporhodopirellula aestuarii]MCM2370868.1 hypothetical protein [Aporhodopirellula aestuarii]
MHDVIRSTRLNEDVSIDGELICEATSSIGLTACDERTFVLKSYALRGGGFAVVIEFRSSSSGILDIVEVELVDTATDVEMVFATFEPTEFVSRKTLYGDSQFSQRCDRMRKRLSQAYYKPLNIVQRATEAYVSAHPGCEYIKPLPPSPASPNRILRFLGLIK